MRSTIRRINVGTLAEAVPAAYRPQVRALNLSSSAATVALARGDVLRVREARRLLAKIDKPAEGMPILVLCNDLTEEARELLVQREVLVVALRSHGWSEEGYENIRVLIGSRVKRPRS